MQTLLDTPKVFIDDRAVEDLLSRPSRMVKLLQPKAHEFRPPPAGREDFFALEEINFGVISDIHGKFENAIQIIKKHPDITSWYCLGDVVDFTDRFKTNEKCLDWWEGAKLSTIIGNHDRDYAYACRSTPERNYKLRNLPRSIKLRLPTGFDILMYHSMPNDLVTFVNPGFTEREFIDTYLDIDDNTLAVMIGHNHKQFRQYYPNVACELWSVGAAMFGDYATVNEEGLHFHKL